MSIRITQTTTGYSQALPRQESQHPLLFQYTKAWRAFVLSSSHLLAIYNSFQVDMFNRLRAAGQDPGRATPPSLKDVRQAITKKFPIINMIAPEFVEPEDPQGRAHYGTVKRSESSRVVNIAHILGYAIDYAPPSEKTPMFIALYIYTLSNELSHALTKRFYSKSLESKGMFERQLWGAEIYLEWPKKERGNLGAINAFWAQGVTADTLGRETEYGWVLPCDLYLEYSSGLLSTLQNPQSSTAQLPPIPFLAPPIKDFAPPPSYCRSPVQDAQSQRQPLDSRPKLKILSVGGDRYIAISLNDDGQYETFVADRIGCST